MIFYSYKLQIHTHTDTSVPVLVRVHARNDTTYKGRWSGGKTADKQ